MVLCLFRANGLKWTVDLQSYWTVKCVEVWDCRNVRFETSKNWSAAGLKLPERKSHLPFSTHLPQFSPGRPQLLGEALLCYFQIFFLKANFRHVSNDFSFYLKSFKSFLISNLWLLRSRHSAWHCCEVFSGSTFGELKARKIEGGFLTQKLVLPVHPTRNTNSICLIQSEHWSSKITIQRVCLCFPSYPALETLTTTHAKPPIKQGAVYNPSDHVQSFEKFNVYH